MRTEESTTTETVVYCARHPSVETALTCPSCGIPICPKCMVVTPVGMKCPDCGTYRKTALFQVKPERMVLTVIVSLVFGAIAGFIGEIGFFFVIFIAAAYGYFAGSMILRASGMKRGKKLEIAAGLGMIIGGLTIKIVPAAIVFAVGGGAAALTGLLDIFYWISLIISTACAISKIRYI